MFNVVVLGAAHEHILNLAHCVTAMHDAHIVGVWDNAPDRRQSTSKQLGVPELPTLSDALKHKPDVALIGSIPCDRSPIACRALSAGASVLIDKPIAVTHQALHALKEAAEQNNRPAITYYPYRGRAELMATKQFIDQRHIGPLVSISANAPHKLMEACRPQWMWNRDTNGGILIDIACHGIDLACWFSQSAPQWLCARHANLAHQQHSEFQDHGHLIATFESGTTAYISVDWLNPESQATNDVRLDFQCTRGKIEIRLGDPCSARYWTHHKKAQPLPIPLNLLTGQEWTQALIRELAKGQCTLIPQSAVWRASQLSLRAFDSANAQGKPINLSDALNPTKGQHLLPSAPVSSEFHTIA